MTSRAASTGRSGTSPGSPEARGTMRAMVHDPATASGLCLGRVVVPEPGPSQVLVGVSAISLNYGELAYLAERQPPGAVPGWDAAGTVLAAAADGSGQPVGTPVATFGWAGGWAEQRTVDTDQLAVVPAGLDAAQAAAVPVAGVTALRALRRLGPVLGRRVLITGASGGVGRFAVQLAAHAGAHVVAATGASGRARGLTDLGARQTTQDISTLAPVDAVIDTVGGAVLEAAFALLAPGAILLSVGSAAAAPAAIDFEAARRRGGGRIEAFSVGSAFGPDLAYLLELLADGRLDPQIGWRVPWQDIDRAAHALLERRVQGKAVLEVTP
jgi:NADPH:quinone reductase